MGSRSNKKDSGGVSEQLKVLNNKFNKLMNILISGNFPKKQPKIKVETIITKAIPKADNITKTKVKKIQKRVQEKVC